MQVLFILYTVLVCLCWVWQEDAVFSPWYMQLFKPLLVPIGMFAVVLVLYLIGKGWLFIYNFLGTL